MLVRIYQFLQNAKFYWKVLFQNQVLKERVLLSALIAGHFLPANAFGWVILWLFLVTFVLTSGIDSKTHDFYRKAPIWRGTYLENRKRIGLHTHIHSVGIYLIIFTFE